MNPAPSIRELYRDRIEERTRTAARLAGRDLALSSARLIVFLASVVFFVLAFVDRAVPFLWFGLLLALFIALVFVHEDVTRALSRARRARAHYERGLLRLDDRWSGVGATGDRFLDPAHPYAPDLDLFGTGSLFQRLTQARTRAGEARLAHWLLEPAAPAEIRARHAALAELAPGLDLREEMAILGEELEAGLHPESLLAWANEPARLGGRGLALLAWGGTTLCLAALAAWIATDLGASPLLVVVALQIALVRVRRQQAVLRAWHGAARQCRDLDLLAEILKRLEREQFEAPWFVRMKGHLAGEGQPASRAVRRLHFLVDSIERMRNPFFWPIGFVLLWDVHFALALETWRLRHGARIQGWLEGVSDFEAISSLANYHAERPDDVFPELLEPGTVEQSNRGRFEAEELGHPLIARAVCVRNDVALGRDLRLLVVSGSNMSGKSTFLRTVGVAAVLAQMGAPVDARRLRLTRLRVGASIRNQDSLQEGVSRFYAEIRRLAQIVELSSGEEPVLFLADEILNGTNSHDRRLGARAVVENLLRRGAFGLFSTHDLALTRIKDELGPTVANVHFADEVLGDELHFDYRLRPGVVTRSNALRLMRAVGLDVPDSPSTGLTGAGIIE